MFYTFNLYTTLSSFMINFDDLRTASYKLCSSSTRHRNRIQRRKLWLRYNIWDLLPLLTKSWPVMISEFPNLKADTVWFWYKMLVYSVWPCKISECKWHCKMLIVKKIQCNCMHDPCINWDLSTNINHRLQILYAVLLSRNYITTYLRIYFSVLSFLRVTFQSL